MAGPLLPNAPCIPFRNVVGGPPHHRLPSQATPITFSELSAQTWHICTASKSLAVSHLLVQMSSSAAPSHRVYFATQRNGYKYVLRLRYVLSEGATLGMISIPASSVAGTSTAERHLRNEPQMAE